jgi:hypothetical protein
MKRFKTKQLVAALSGGTRKFASSADQSEVEMPVRKLTQLSEPRLYGSARQTLGLRPPRILLAVLLLKQALELLRKSSSTKIILLNALQ